jgi:hypothetical protein
MGWWGLAEAAEESLLGEESREEEGSEDKEWGDIGLPNGETANISATKKPTIKANPGHTGIHAASPNHGSPARIRNRTKKQSHLCLMAK